ncbi:MAG: hypothetical protein PHG85_04655 [Candidatus Altiarchaeota archaeon]|nr:hypothetical protein [Candidatus Altiarchaeota archaeon]
MFDSGLMRMDRLFAAVAVLALFAGTVQAAKMEASLLWKYDVKVPNQNLYAVDVNGDGRTEVVADGPQSGVVYVIGGDGVMIWKYGTGTYFYDCFATEPDDNGAFLVVGMFQNVHMVDTNGKSVWKRSLRFKETARSVFAADLNDDGLLESLAGIFSGMNSNIELLDSNGNTIKEVGMKGREIPYAMLASDVNGDNMPELLVGGASFSVNTVAENYELNPGAGNFYVFGGDGTLIWSNGDGVLSIAAGNLAGDKRPEIVVGTNNEVIAYDGSGGKLWSFVSGGKVAGVAVEDVNNDSIMEVVAAAGKKVFLLDSSGKKKWEYNVDTQVMSIDVKDIDGGGMHEILIGSTTVEVINEKGEKLWESEAYNTITKVLAADVNGDSYNELVAGCSDGWIRVFDTSKYAKGQRAVNYKNLAEAEYDQMHYAMVEDYAENAIMLYEDLKDAGGMKAVRDLLEKTTLRKEADNYYNSSLLLFKAGDYVNASASATKANDIYRRLSVSFERIAELNEIITSHQNLTSAKGAFNHSMSLYEQGQYEEARAAALQAQELLTALNETSLARLAGEIYNKSADRLAANGYMDEANALTDAGNQSASEEYYRMAGEVYLRLGDANASQTVNEKLEAIENAKQKRSLRSYGWTAIAAVIALCIVLLVVIAFAFIIKIKGGELKLLSGGGEEGPGRKGGSFDRRSGSTLGSARDR